MKLPIVGGAYLARSTNIAADRCVNLYPEVAGTGSAKSVAALIGCPGTRLLLNVSINADIYAVRGMYVPTVGTRFLVVCGNRVWWVSDSFIVTSAGTLLTYEGRVSFSDNGTTGFIVDGDYGYTITLAGASTVSQIVDPDFLGADVVDYLDGYGIFNKPRTQQFYISSLLGTSFDALDFASAEGSPDVLVSLIVDHGELLLFGQYSTEVFYDTGNPDFPLERQNTRIEVGCSAVHSVAKIDNAVIWLGGTKIGGASIYMMRGYQPQVISTHAIDFAISGYTTISDAFAFTFTFEGHSFYWITFPTGNATWVYDLTTNLWHERAYLDPVSGVLGRHRANSHVYFAGKHLVGDFENGNIYELDPDYYSDNGEAMPAIRTFGHTAADDYGYLYWDSLQVDLEAGVGTVTSGSVQVGDNTDPVIMLDYSDDGGHTWSAQRTAKMGKVGEYRKRARWLRLGRSRDRVNRITITDAVKRIIIGASASVRKGGN